MKKIAYNYQIKTQASDLLTNQNIDYPLPCGANRHCGKCLIKIEGKASPICDQEAALLGKERLEQGFRLACFAQIWGEGYIFIPQTKQQQILTDGITKPQHNFKPIFDADHYGLVIDIGTTTVVAYLLDAKGDIVARVSAANAQRRFGADIISRIQYGIENDYRSLVQAIDNQLSQFIDELCSSAKITMDKIEKGIITGNTTMLHYFADFDPKPIGFVPFKPHSLFNSWHKMNNIDFYLPPCTSAYTGADLSCCLLKANMFNPNQTAIIADIGTNGEIALSHQGRVLSCATAAGPAFEGVGIEHGMSAESGAIWQIEQRDGQLIYQTIDNQPARGFCGSGILDMIAVLLASSACNLSGQLQKGGHILADYIGLDEQGIAYIAIPGTEIRFTQADIRQVQLAKSAIAAGILTLMAKLGLKSEDIDNFYLAGGFGSYLDINSAAKIGLIPPGLAAKVDILGNAAAGGAALLLLAEENIEYLAKQTKAVDYIELSADQEFMNIYIKEMSF